jgi:hypothetical protein
MKFALALGILGTLALIVVAVGIFSGAVRTRWTCRIGFHDWVNLSGKDPSARENCACTFCLKTDLRGDRFAAAQRRIIDAHREPVPGALSVARIESEVSR